MTDTRSPEQRRRIMQAVKAKDTGPEWIVRRWLFARGYRYRLHRKDLPGSPDIVLPRHRIAIFVHGCFWHGHGCRYGQIPKSRPEFWQPKIARNKERDTANAADLRGLGWQVVTVWQCETRDRERLAVSLSNFPGDIDRAPIDILGSDC